MIDSDIIDRVQSFKVLGFIISSDLNWKAHVAYIVSKACRRLFVVYHLLRAGVSCSDIIAVYCSLIRSVLEYCAPVWHCGLTLTQSAEIESVQKRVLKLIFPSLSYTQALALSSLERLSDRRERLSITAFNQIKSDSNILHDLLVPNNTAHDVNLRRDKYPYMIPRLNTDRALRSFIFYAIRKRW